MAWHARRLSPTRVSQGFTLVELLVVTDPQGVFRLRASTQQEGAALGRHRVMILDLSVSTGVYRSDNGTLDADPTKSKRPPPVRRSRVPGKFLSLTETPLSKEVQPGHQFIDLDIR